MASPTSAIDVDADVTAPSARIVRGTGDAAAPLELASSDDEAAREPLNIVKLAKLDKHMTSEDRARALWKEGHKKLVAHGVDHDHVGDDDFGLCRVKHGIVDIDDDAYLEPLFKKTMYSAYEELHPAVREKLRTTKVGAILMGLAIDELLSFDKWSDKNKGIYGYAVDVLASILANACKEYGYRGHEAYLEGEEAYLEFLAQEGKKADEALETARKKRRLG